MDLMQIKGFHRVNGESRMPDTGEHLKHIRWNNDLGVFEYVDSDADDTFINDVTVSGEIVTIHRNDGTTWSFTVPEAADLIMPGDTMILFDEDGAIGGKVNMTYDRVLQRLVLTDSQGLFGKNTTYDSTPQSVLQYLGNNSLFVNFGDIKTPVDILNNNAIGKLALASLQTGEYNVALGSYAGSSIGTASKGNVFIGSYSGRIEPGDNKLYIHNKDYATLAEFRANSLFYGEFDIGLLHINNRLDVSEEVQIGTFDVTNTPSGGMVQFVDAGSGLVKPQYYNASAWVDFANGSNYYLDGISKSGDTYTFSVNGSTDVTVNIPVYPASGSLYKLQLSNGDNTFTHDDDLFWGSDNVLTVQGAVTITPGDFNDFTAREGIIVNIGEHIYAYLDGQYVQLDNDLTSGEANHGENIGTTVEIYSGINASNHNLQFFELEAGDKINIATADVNGNIKFDVDYAVSGNSLGTSGKSIYHSTTNTPTTSIVNIRKLYSSDGSITITEAADYLDISAPAGGAASGEVNDGENEGSGSGRIYDEVNKKNGLNILFRTLKEGDNTSIVTNIANKEITIDVDSFVVSAANISGGEGVYKNYTEASGKRTLNLRPIKGVDGVDVVTNADIIEVGLNASMIIPSISGIKMPSATNVNKTLTWNVILDEDIANSNPQLEPIVELNLGSNIVYDPSTNTLESIGSSDPLVSIHAVNINRYDENIGIDPEDPRYGSVDRSDSVRDVLFTSAAGIEHRWYGEGGHTLGLGWLAFENDYPLATNTFKGLVQVDTSTGLTIDDGMLGLTLPTIPDAIDAVLYAPTGYNLHDYDDGNDGYENSETIITRRDRARHSIGGAYVNGTDNEPFVTKELFVDSAGHFDTGGFVGGTKGLHLYNNKITSTWDTVELVKNNNQGFPLNVISLSNGIMDLTIDPNDLAGDIGIFNFYMYNTSGSKIKVATIKGRYEDGELVADLKIKGDIKFHCTDAEMNS